MHIYFSGIGGTGIGPLALIAHQAGFEVSGSDKQNSQYTEYLMKHGVRLHIGQTTEQISEIHNNTPIDWFVYSSALPLESPDHPELVFVEQNNIKHSKRDDCLNMILQQKKLKLIAVAGTHGKTTTTAMIIWLFKELGLPISYSVGAKISFGDMGNYDKNSQYFVYECDEFDRNFLSFRPDISAITIVDWDHHEIYPTRDSYKQAFRQFISQSVNTSIFKRDADYLNITSSKNINIVSDSTDILNRIKLAGLHNRQNAVIAISAIQNFCDKPIELLIEIISRYPGSSRRFEKIANNLYTDYAHTPEEVAATIQLARELSDNVVVIYEPLTDRRQHFTKDLYTNIFKGVKQLFWLPSYLAREDKNTQVIPPAELIEGLHGVNAHTAKKDASLKNIIDTNLSKGSLVLCLAGGGGGSLDEWLRANYSNPKAKHVLFEAMNW